MVLIAIFLAKLIDPVAAILGLILGALSRAWWHVIVAAIVVAGLVEMLLTAMQYTRQFEPVVYAVGVLAAAVWTAAGFLIKRAWKRRNAQE